MEEQNIIEMLRNENYEFIQLEEEHKKLEDELSTLESKYYLTPEEQMKIKAIKKKKLSRKDRMAELIREYKNKE